MVDEKNRKKLGALAAAMKRMEQASNDYVAAYNKLFKEDKSASVAAQQIYGEFCDAVHETWEHMYKQTLWVKAQQDGGFIDE